LDGDRVGDRELDPAFTDYDSRVLYSTYDLTAELDEGRHVVGFLLGRGRYAAATETAWKWQEAPWHSERPHLRAQLEILYDDGSTDRIESNGSWVSTPTATQFDCLFTGEKHDARESRDLWSLSAPEMSSESWSEVEIVDGPEGDMEPQRLQAIRAFDEVSPEAVTEPSSGTYVFDFGEMVVGWVELSASAPRGTRVTLLHGEKLDESGHVDVTQGHVNGQLQTDEYVFAGSDTEAWAPKFSYKGFRYIEVTGLPRRPNLEMLTARSVNTDVDNHDSAFACSDSLLEQIHENCQRALLSNLQGVPTDSPTYEKNSWTGDTQLATEATIYNFDMARFYRKWLADCADAQRPDGELPCIVPTSGWGYADSDLGGITGPIPAWDCAYVLIPWWVYRYYGDRDTLATHYDGMKRLVEYLGRHTEDGVLRKGLGDWVPPGAGNVFEEMKPPEGPSITSTAYYYRASEVVADTARVLGKDDQAAAFDQRCETINEAFEDAFYDPERGIYSTGEVDGYRQTSNVLPVAMGLVPPERASDVVSSIVADIDRRDGHLNTGILGTKYLLPTLTAHGHVDTAYRVATKRTHPSWGNWIEAGATSLYEAWELTSRSRNHRMYATIEDWFYRWLGGIRPAQPGFERVHIEPHHPTELDSVSAAVETVRGTVSCDWTATESGYQHELRIPPNTTADVHLPKPVESVSRADADSETTEYSVSDSNDVEGRHRLRLEPGHWTLSSE
jgi:alpha-L-rhamnosidase